MFTAYWKPGTIIELEESAEQEATGARLLITRLKSLSEKIIISQVFRYQNEGPIKEVLRLDGLAESQSVCAGWLSLDAILKLTCEAILTSEF